MRIIFDPEDVRLLCSNARTERFLPLRGELLRCAKGAPEEDLKEENPAFHRARRILRMALVYLIEADRNCGEMAKEFILELATSDSFADWMRPFHKKQHPTMLSDLHLAEVSLDLVLASEALSEILTPHDRERIEAGLMKRAVEPILADVESRIWWTEAYNCNWCGVMYAALGITALYLKDLQMVRLAEERIRRVLDAAGPCGEGVEGVSYWLYNFSRAALLTEALSRTGESILKSHPFWGRALDFPFSLLMPDCRGWVPFSDTPYMGFHHEHFFYWLAGYLWDRGEEEGARRAQWLGDKITEVNRQKADPLSLLWRREEIEPQAPEEGPSCRLFPLIHTAVFRTGWDEGGGLFVFKGGSNDSPHRHLDLASIVLAIGDDRLLVDPGKGEYSFRYWTSITPPVSTPWHNTLVVDGSNQRDLYTFFGDENVRRRSPSACRIEEFRHHGSAALLSADATSAYSDQLERYHRHLFWLPEVVAILDDIMVKDREIKRDLALHYHTPCDVEVLDQGGTALIKGRQTHLLLRVLGSSDCFLEVSEPVQIGGASLRRLTLQAYWTLRHPNLEETSRVRFLTLLLPLPSGEGRPEVLVHKETDLLAAKVEKGDESITLLFPRGRGESFGVSTDARGCLIRRDPEGMKALLILEGSEVRVEGREVIFAEERKSFCWTGKGGLRWPPC